MMIFNTASHGVTTVSKTFEKVPIGFQYFFIEFSCNQSWEMPDTVGHTSRLAVNGSKRRA